MSSDNESTSGLVRLWMEHGETVQVLGIAGFAGAFVRGLMAPERKWKRRVIQSSVGVLSAVFLGGAIASLFEGMMTHSVYSYLAAGFVCGTLGEGAVAFAQRKFIGDQGQ